MRKNMRFKKKRSRSVTDKSNRLARYTFSATILSAIIVAGTTILGFYINKASDIEYVEHKTSEWDIDYASNYYPLEKGYYWYYEGILETSSNQYQDYERAVTLKTEVVDMNTNGDVILYGIKNAFEEFDGFEYYFTDKIEKQLDLGKGISGYLLIANEIYYIPIDLYELTKEAVGGEESNLDIGKIDLNQFEILYRMPLFKGQRFGDLDSITRKDLAYFWYVNDFFETEKVKNKKIYSVKNFEMINYGISFKLIKHFTPNIGVTNISFNNQRVKLNLDLKKYKVD